MLENEYESLVEKIRAERVRLLEDRIGLERIASDSNSEKVIEYCEERLRVIRELG